MGVGGYNNIENNPVFRGMVRPAEPVAGF